MTCPKCGSKNSRQIDRRKAYFPIVIFCFICGFTVLIYGIHRMVNKGNSLYVVISIIFLFAVIAIYHILEKVKGLDKTNKCSQCGEFY
jgi:uncharacterized protein (DUF983 family)